MNLQIMFIGIVGVVVVFSVWCGDVCGSFGCWFCDEELVLVLQGSCIVQVNNLFMVEFGSVCGMYFQYVFYVEKKFICCLVGCVFDVVLDLCKGLFIFLQWCGVELVVGDDCVLLVLEGCVYGFQVLEVGSLLFYLYIVFYVSYVEGGVCYDDLCVVIVWLLLLQNLLLCDFQYLLLVFDFDGILL